MLPDGPPVCQARVTRLEAEKLCQNPETSTSGGELYHLMSPVTQHDQTIGSSFSGQMTLSRRGDRNLVAKLVAYLLPAFVTSVFIGFSMVSAYALACIIRLKSVGTMIRVKTVDTSSPPSTTAPRPR